MALRSPAEGPAVYRWPLAGPVRVVRGFSAPLSRYGPGHLGADLAASPRVTVRAAAAGTVRFAGQVAGRGVVVILHPDGISTEYEPVTPAVRVGAAVAAGQPVGVLRGNHVGCPVHACLHWGARRADTYLDPVSLLQPLGVVRLLPWDWHG